MSTSLPPVRVLLVDDQRIVGEAVKRLVAPEPRIQLFVEQDPNLAIQRATELEATVILQDLIMPGVDGLDLVLAYRQTPATADVPLVVLSSREDPVVKAEAFARGANDYLVKLPAGPELIARLLYHSRAFQDRRERAAAFAELELSQQRLAKSNELILRLFGRYVDEDVVSAILSDPDGVSVDGERRVLSILVADMRGFTRISDDLSPEQVVRLLNNYTRPLIDTIQEWGGTLDNIIGDGLFVLFGAPVTMEEHARRAVGCALAMQRTMVEVNRRNAEDGLPPVEMGIGVHTGEVVAGNIGSHKRAKYSVMGRNVNLAARIQGYTSGGQIFISDATRAAVGDDLRYRGTFEASPKGFRDVFTVYDLLGLGEGPDLDAEPGRLRPVSPSLPALLLAYEDKKAVGPPATVWVQAVTTREIVLASAPDLQVGTEVRLERSDRPDGVWSFFGLVVQPLSDTPGSLTVRWTDGTHEARAWLRDL